MDQEIAMSLPNGSTLFNYSNGYIVEYKDACESWLLLPGENFWDPALRCFFYIMAMLYLFVGVAITSDVFMGSIEIITSKKRTVVKYDRETGEQITREVLIWNETVANLSLMALGSSAPEILLSVVETLRKIGDRNSAADGLGSFTIIGSASFNLLIITAICIISVPAPHIKSIKEFGVFLVTAVWSVFAYIWMLIVITIWTPNKIDIYEAWITFLFFPLLIFTAWAQDQGWWWKKRIQIRPTDDKSVTVRVVSIKSQHASAASTVTMPPRDLSTIHPDGIASRKSSILYDGDSTATNAKLSTSGAARSRGGSARTSLSKSSLTYEDRCRVHVDIQPSNTFARARFRHAAIRTLMGGKRHKAAALPSDRSHYDLEGSLGTNHIQPKMANLVNMITHRLNEQSNNRTAAATFVFANSTHSIREDAGSIQLTVLLNRHRSRARNPLPSINPVKTNNGLFSINASKSDSLLNKNYARSSDGIQASWKAITEESEKQVILTTQKSDEDEEEELNTFCVDFETRDGSAKQGVNFKYTSGRLTFNKEEYQRSINIDILNDGQYHPNLSFYVILKNASEDCKLADPSVTLITIIDTNVPGEFQFERSKYYVEKGLSFVKVKILRTNGVDGTVHLEFVTIDGSAHGGTKFEVEEGKKDYETRSDVLIFDKNETEKDIILLVNEEATANKNFLIALRNASMGARIGEIGATIIHFGQEDADVLADRVAEFVALKSTETEDVTWAEQFRVAMTVGSDVDELGEELPPSNLDYVLHFIAFLWKIIAATIPPRTVLGGWPAFVLSLVYIGFITAVIEQLGNLLGCVVLLKPSVTGITLVALGTSLPDTFASRNAALHDQHADASIGNVTGSNSVNVFLGLGLPWVIVTTYRQVSYSDSTYHISPGNLQFSVILFASVAAVAVAILLLRRFLLGGELGGTLKSQYISALSLFILWIVYIVLASLRAYDVIVI